MSDNQDPSPTGRNPHQEAHDEQRSINDSRDGAASTSDYERKMHAYRGYSNPYAHEPLQDLRPKTLLKHSALFLLTVATVTERGIAFTGRFETAESVWSLIADGLLFAFLLLAFLATHEFGHYFAAVKHRVRTSLPYFIPLPFTFIGTFGAVIRIKEPVSDSRKLFDIGIAGPVAGFVVSLIILIIGFATLPGPEHIMHFPGHEGVKAYVMEHGAFPDEPLPDEQGELLVLGNTLLYSFLASFFEHVPPMWEMYHYPFLFAGWLGLFFTALNLMPVGQLDGGHILYCLIGYRKHRIFARGFFVTLVMLGGVGAVPVMHMLLESYDNQFASLSWSLWALVAFMMIRRGMRGDWRWVLPSWLIAVSGAFALVYGVVGFDPTAGFFIWFVWSLFLLFLVGIEHPPVYVEVPLTRNRRILGWIAIAVFVLCISPSPVYIIF
ncbi:MAG: site-2 protease family protein [Balneolales bacterium]|nr:site-2 protease family protein [Balneolales bacterium]